MVQVSPQYTPRYRGPRRGPTTNYVNEDLKRLAERAKRAREAAEYRQSATDVANAAQAEADKAAVLKNVTATSHSEINQTSPFSITQFLLGTKSTTPIANALTGGAWKLGKAAFTYGAKPVWQYGIGPVAGVTKDVIQDVYTDFDSKEQIADLDKAQARRAQINQELAREEVDPRFRPNTPEEQEQYNAWARYRDEFRKTASGAYPESPVREGYLMPSGEREQPGVTGALMSPLEAIQESAAQTVAMALTTPGISDVAKIFGTENFDLGVEAMEETAAKLRSMGVSPDQAAWLAYHSNDLPKFVKGALEFGLDPINLLPGIGWGGSIAKGAKIAAALKAGTKGNALRTAATESPEVMARRSAQQSSGTSDMEEIAKAIQGDPIDEVDALNRGTSQKVLNEANQAKVDADASLAEALDLTKTLPIDEHLIISARAKLSQDEDGFIAWFIDNIPGLKKTRTLEQDLKTTAGRQVAIAQHSADGMRGPLDVHKTALVVAMDEINRVFKSVDGVDAMSGGRVDVLRNSIGTDIEGFAGHGRMLDILERPSAYNLKDAQKAAIKTLRETENNLIDAINPYLKNRKINKVDVQEGGAYVPHRDLSRSTEENLADVQNALREQRRAFGKPRKYDTYYDRWVAARQAEGPLPDPDLNLKHLLHKNMDVKIEAGADEVFQRVSGGLSKTDVIETLIPNLGKRIKNTRRRLRGLQKSLKGIDDIAEEGQKSLYDEIEDALDITDDISIVKAFDDPTIYPETTGAYVPQLARKGLTMEDLNRLEKLLYAAAGRGMHNTAVTRRMRQLADELSSLKDEWTQADNAIDAGRTNFVKAKAGNRTVGYYDRTSAKIVDRLHSHTETANARHWMAVKQTVFGGDFSPVFLNAASGFLTHPWTVTKQILRAFNMNHEGVKGIRRIFSTKALLEDIAADRAWWDDWFLYSGRGLGTPEELGGGLLRKIPAGRYFKGLGWKKELDLGSAFASWNDTVFSMVERGAKNIFKEQTQNYIEQGFPEHIAKALAAQDASGTFLLPTGGKLGSSEFARKYGSKMITSVTFLKRPAEMIERTITGFVKIANGIPVTASEKMAIRRMATLYGMASGIAVTSAAYDALERGRDPMKAALAALDPYSSSFMKLHVPPTVMGKGIPIIGGIGIPIGGPFRAAFKLVAGRPITRNGPTLPFGGLRQFATGRIHPAARAVIENPLFGKGEELFSGEKILSENSPVWINALETLAWGTEQVLPLTIGELSEGLRRRRSLGETAERSLYQGLGVNAYSESPYRKRNELAMQYAETYLSEEEAKKVRGFYDLPPFIRAKLQEAEPELVAEIMDETERQAKFGDVAAQKIVAADHEKQRSRMFQGIDDDKLRGGTLTPLDWKSQNRQRKAELGNKRDGIYLTTPNTQDPRTPTDFYYKQQDLLKEKYGLMTDEAWDELDVWIIQQSKPDQKYIELNTGLGPYTETEQAYNRAMEHLAKSGWFRVKETLVEKNPAVSALYDAYKRLPTRSDQAEFLRENPALDAALERASSAQNLIRQQDRLADAIVGYWWGRGGFQQRYNIGKQGSEIAQYLTQKRYGPVK